MSDKQCPVCGWEIDRIMELEQQLAELRERTCTWRVSSQWDMPIYSTECGEEYVFNDAPPEDYVKFCQGCGGKMVFKQALQGGGKNG